MFWDWVRLILEILRYSMLYFISPYTPDASYASCISLSILFIPTMHLVNLLPLYRCWPCWIPTSAWAHNCCHLPSVCGWLEAHPPQEALPRPRCCWEMSHRQQDEQTPVPGIPWHPWPPGQEELPFASSQPCRWCRHADPWSQPWRQPSESHSTPYSSEASPGWRRRRRRGHAAGHCCHDQLPAHTEAPKKTHTIWQHPARRSLNSLPVLLGCGAWAQWRTNIAPYTVNNWLLPTAPTNGT